MSRLIITLTLATLATMPHPAEAFPLDQKPAANFVASSEEAQASAAPVQVFALDLPPITALQPSASAPPVTAASVDTAPAATSKNAPDEMTTRLDRGDAKQPARVNIGNGFRDSLPAMNVGVTSWRDWPFQTVKRQGLDYSCGSAAVATLLTYAYDKPVTEKEVFLAMFGGGNQVMVKRPVNVGFSGGEKKRMEILQMAMLEPSLCVLDETDSGLDIDAVRIVSEGVNALRNKDRAMLVITHYQRLLDYIVPDRVHVLAMGRIIKSGGPELAHELEARGYDEIVKAA